MLFIPKVSYSLARCVGSGHGVSIDREEWDHQWHLVRSQAPLNSFCPWTSYSVYHLRFTGSMWTPCLDVTESNIYLLGVRLEALLSPPHESSWPRNPGLVSN